MQCTVCIPQVINIVCRFCRLPWVRSRSQLQSQVAMSEYSYPRVAYHCEDEDMEMKANESQASKNRADKTSHRSRRNMNGKACSFGQKHKRLFFLPPSLLIHDEHMLQIYNQRHVRGLGLGLLPSVFFLKQNQFLISLQLLIISHCRHVDIQIITLFFL